MEIKEILEKEFTKFLELSKTDVIMKPEEWARKCDKAIQEAFLAMDKDGVLTEVAIIIAVCGDCPFHDKEGFGDEDCHACQRQLNGVAKAQFQADIKWLYEFLDKQWISRSTDDVGTYEFLISQIDELKESLIQLRWKES